MRRIATCSLALLVSIISACGKKDDAPVATVVAGASANAPAATPPVPGGQPDFGGVTKISREVETVGSTQELAVLAALQMAVAQINGVAVASQMQSARAELNLTVNGQAAGSARSEGFAQKAISASHGAVTGFTILSQEQIDKIDEEAVSRVRASDGGFSYSASASSDRSIDMRADGRSRAQVEGASAEQSNSFAGSASRSDKANVDAKRGASSYESDVTYTKMRSYWKVRVLVEVAQFHAPEEQGRPKIVVAMPRTLMAGYPVGDANVASTEVAQAVRGRLSDILTQTKRFIVLDREFGTEMQAEIDHIGSGAVRVQDSSRLGQQLATDLILIPTIERFEYPRHAQKLRMSDRELVSYTGGGRITLRLLNAATGEVVMSNSFERNLVSADPSTMPRVIDGKSMAAGLMDSLANQIGSAIVTEIFPVTVVALNGDQAVLSQGGESLRVGERWLAVALGEELKDPQTGRSLGRNETPIGNIRIDRVSGKLSYGTFEGGAPSLSSQPFRAGSIELRKEPQAPRETVAAAEKPTLSQSSMPTTAAPPVRKAAADSGKDPLAPTDRPLRKDDKDEEKKW